MAEQRDFYTVVFEGRLRDIKGNPFNIESPFGRVHAAGHGDAIAREDALEDLAIAAGKAMHLADHCVSRGMHEIKIGDDTESVADLSGDLACALNVIQRR